MHFCKNNISVFGEKQQQQEQQQQQQKKSPSITTEKKDMKRGDGKEKAQTDIYYWLFFLNHPFPSPP